MNMILLFEDKGRRNIDFSKLFTKEFCFTVCAKNLQLIKEIFL